MKTILSVVLPTVALVALAATLPLQAETIRIVQTNAAGDSVMLIDPATNKVVGEIKDIEVNHGAAAAPDGSRLYITNEAESTLDVADLKTPPTRDGVRPMAFETNPDGSTKRIFVQLSNFNGFITIDFATHQIADEIKLPELPAAERVTEGLQGSPAHGLAVTADGKTLC